MFMYTRVCASSMRELARRNISSNSDVMQARAALSYMCSEPRCNIYIYICYIHIYMYIRSEHTRRSTSSNWRGRASRARAQGFPSHLTPCPTLTARTWYMYLCSTKYVFFAYTMSSLPTKYVFCTYKIYVLYLQIMCSMSHLPPCPIVCVFS